MALSQSSKIPLPSSSPLTTSLLLEPTSLSLALLHSDSSLSLYPSLPSSFLPLKLPTSSSSSFLLLRNGSDSRVLFLAASPHKGASQILLQIYILQKSNLFSRARVVCNQKGIGFDSRYGVVLDANHGVSVKIGGSVNYFAVYSVSSRRVWVFALRLVGDDGDSVKLMRCATIECCRPVWSVSVSSAFLILGEDGGVRVFHLRQLVKGNAKKVKSSNSIGKSDKEGRLESNQSLLTACNGSLDPKIEKLSYLVKQKSMRCREDSDDGGSLFMTFNSRHTEGLILKAVSVQALSPNKFVILDSVGDLHMLSLSGGNTRNQMIHFPQSMKVQKLAVLPDISSRNQSFWVSDGVHSVHMMSLCETEGAVSHIDGDNIEEKQIKISASQAIFCDEEVRDLAPLSGNNILILGRGYPVSVIQAISDDSNITCSTKLRSLGELNYPSFSVVFTSKTTVKYTRELTNVGVAGSTYKVEVSVPPTVTVMLQPSVLVFKHVADKLKYSITFAAKKNMKQSSEAEIGSIVCSNKQYLVRSPTAITWS